MSTKNKQQQHENSRAKDLGQLLKEDSTLIKLKEEEVLIRKSLERSSNQGNAVEDWDLILNGDGDGKL